MGISKFGFRAEDIAALVDGEPPLPPAPPSRADGYGASLASSPKSAISYGRQV